MNDADFIIKSYFFEIVTYIFTVVLQERENNQAQLNKLSEECLTRQPDEVFDLLCKLGEGILYMNIF